MIVVRISEGIGNQMFKYAYAYSLQKRLKKKGITVYIDIRPMTGYYSEQIDMKRDIKINCFPISLPIAKENQLVRWDYLKRKSILDKLLYWLQSNNKWKYKSYYEGVDFNYSERKLYQNDNTYIDGWFQNEKYFIDYKNDILKEYSYQLSYPEYLEEYFAKYEVVAIHVRRGDYVTNRNARRALCVCDSRYYSKAISYINENVKNPFYFIFTNDEKWVVNNIEFNDNFLIITGRFQLNDLEEMIFMSKCKHNIIANSTYSWWGAWLNENEDKIVIAPRKWFKRYGRLNISSEKWIQM